MRSLRLCTILTLAAALGMSGVANATVVGRPASLDITITQGGSTVVQALGVSIPGADPLDGENYIPIGDIGGLSTIYLSVWMQDTGADESLISFYVRAGDTSTPLTAGILPLFDLGGSGDINVSIDNLEFKVGALASDVTVAQFDAPLGDDFCSMYMMNSSGWYYELPEAEPVWLGPKLTHQVKYSDFRDVTIDPYYFKNDSGASLDIGWYNMYSPVDSVYAITQSDAPYASEMDTSGGKVFEMGLGAYAWSNPLPEPGTVALLAVGGLASLRRRRR